MDSFGDALGTTNLHLGLFLGGSSAMNCVGAERIARQLGPGHTIVTVLCDSGQRYLSSIYGDVAERILAAAAETTPSPPSHPESSAVSSSSQHAKVQPKMS